MADRSESLTANFVPIISHDTALCILPPEEICTHVNGLRQLYDKSYRRWPPHVNLVYPFVAVSELQQAQQRIQQALDRYEVDTSFSLRLDNANHFLRPRNSNIHLRAGSESIQSLRSIRTTALHALGRDDDAYTAHLTIGQSEDETTSSREFLHSKAKFLPPLEFRVGALAILVRDQGEDPTTPSRMKLWGTINLRADADVWIPRKPEYWLRDEEHVIIDSQEDEDSYGDILEKTSFDRSVRHGTTYWYNRGLDEWSVATGYEINNMEVSSVTVASYNVLVDSEYPLARGRDAQLVHTIMSESASADILVLQEVTDEFLNYLLKDSEVRRKYAFTSHAPPSQSWAGPLPSLRNIVILSSWMFEWSLVPFKRRHKSALVARFEGITESSASGEHGLVVAGMHLSCGLTDGSVAAKKVQVQTLMRYLTEKFEEDPWIVVGDFNLTTSKHTISTALKNNAITPQTVENLALIEVIMADHGLIDTWSIAQIEATNDDNTRHGVCFEGEEGATFNPPYNVLAAATSGSCHNRPQRYDRIFVRPQETYRVARFNHFGLPEKVEDVQVVASDHSGVRTIFSIIEDVPDETNLRQETGLSCSRAGDELSDSEVLTSILTECNMFPTVTVEEKYQEAYELLCQTILGTSNADEALRSEIPMVLTTVGSYAMDVWTSDSDIDCLCIGSISSRTFFKLARQRILKAKSQGIRIVRKVEANTGTMLEIWVKGVLVDLQYCPAARIVERWHDLHTVTIDDPVFNLSMLSLRKLKPYRDLLHINRTSPSLFTFRLAYRCIKLWALQRGLYSARFGYLSGIKITLMLSSLQKRLAHSVGHISVADLLLAFFSHYSQFDWTNKVVYDPFFHRRTPRYHRTSREPMVILGHHTPNSNVAHTATVPSLKTLVSEFKAAKELLSLPETTWNTFFETTTDSVTHIGTSLGETSAVHFIQAYSNFVKIDIYYWGRLLSKGKGLLGWIESRCPMLIVDINKTIPNFDIRIWPARFTSALPSTDPNPPSSDYHGCILIGLSQFPDTNSMLSKDDCQPAKQALDNALDRFLTVLKTDDKHYDETTCWVDVALAKQSEVRTLQLDTRDWAALPDYLEPDSDDEDADLDTADLIADDTSTPIAHLTNTLPHRSSSTTTPLSPVPLRPASDILSRLRWDPAYNPTDYVIGYMDRFVGPKEIGVEKWKSEVEDEEFIPLHRVLWFRRVVRDGDEELEGNGIVWDRRKRLDRIFGSGLGDGTGCRRPGDGSIGGR